MIKDIFHPTPDEEYEYMFELMKKRFGSECRHEQIKNGKCRSCLRRVITKKDLGWH